MKQNVILYLTIIFYFFFAYAGDKNYRSYSTCFPQDIWKIIVKHAEKNDESNFALVNSDIYRAIRTPKFFKKIAEFELKTKVFRGNFSKNEFANEKYDFLKTDMRNILNEYYNVHLEDYAFCFSDSKYFYPKQGPKYLEIATKTVKNIKIGDLEKEVEFFESKRKNKNKKFEPRVMVILLTLNKKENFDHLNSLIEQYPTIKRVIVFSMLDFYPKPVTESIVKFQEYYGIWMKKNIIIQDAFGYTVLHHVKTILKNEGLEKTILLMNFFLECGSDVNIISENKETPLNEAVQSFCKELVELFLNYGANPAFKYCILRWATDNSVKKTWNCIKLIQKRQNLAHTNNQKNDIPKIIELLKKYPCNKDKKITVAEKNMKILKRLKKKYMGNARIEELLGLVIYWVIFGSLLDYSFTGKFHLKKYMELIIKRWFQNDQNPVN